jgi:crotonobetainyl-CoA:carnitine CoA-transferase CaiB-like acyl-CoA transferase
VTGRASPGAAGRIAPDIDVDGLRVVDFSTQIAGPYCSKLLADARADVVVVEPPGGDPLRSWSATGADLAGRDSALFDYLRAGSRSVLGSSHDREVAELVAEADLVIGAHGLETDAGERLDVAELRRRHPSLVVVSITPYGTTGPWRDRRATEFTLQAECGSIGLRGVPGGTPFQAGGRIAEWAAGAYAAVAALAAVVGVRRHGPGTHVDVSVLEVANLVFTNFSEPMNRLLNGGAGDPEHAVLAPSVETPSIEPSADGYVGFCTNARQQFNDFLVLIDRADLLADGELGTAAGRAQRFAEWTAIVHGWCSARTTDEIMEQASLLRIPVSPVGNGETVTRHPQLAARGVYGPDADGRFLRPRPPYLVDGEPPPSPSPAPRRPTGSGGASFPPRSAHRRATGGVDAAGETDGPTDGAVSGRPLAGLRVVDLTAWWAGPAAAHLLATFGADVVHVESPERPDGMRMIGGPMAAHFSQWWEASPHFLHSNTNKRGVTLDLARPEGLELFERLVAWGDAVIENFTPRVLENFGLSWEWVQRVNPEAVLLRMPAYGLDGPWRDRPGFAQNIEQFSGLAWVTGHPDDQPRVPRGPCDPIAGVHGAIALLVALSRRRHSGRGHHVELPLCEVALNVAAEPVVEYSAYGTLMGRDGNRSPTAAPQGLYPCADTGSPTAGWMALSVATDEQWRALRAVMGDPSWAADPSLDTRAGRRRAHDVLDQHLAEWTRGQGRAELVTRLRAAGITASELADPARLVQTNPQLRDRRYFERPEHPVVGPVPLPSLPFRMEGVDRWLRTPAPTVGQDNEAVFCGVLGVGVDDLRRLEVDGVVGNNLAANRS